MLEYPHEAECEMEASDTEKNDLKEEQRKRPIMTNNTVNEAIEKGDMVLICDGMMTGTIGIVGGRKGTSVAVCIQGINGHDCDGMCPSGGTYEPDYALTRLNPKDTQAVDLLVSHLTDADRIATLSYARGVEDSAMVVDNYRGKGAFDLRSIVAAIRSLIPNEKKV